MTILDYIKIYFGVGLIIMVILDLMHRMIKGAVDEETYEKNRYTNSERIYVIVAWPLMLGGLALAVLNNRNKGDDAES